MWERWPHDGVRWAGRPRDTQREPAASPGWPGRIHRFSTRFYRPDPAKTPLTWIGGERIAVGVLPTGATIGGLRAEGVTHVVNCRARVHTFLSQDLAVERALFGAARVAHAPMWDTGWRQHPRRWAAAARFVAQRRGLARR